MIRLAFLTVIISALSAPFMAVQAQQSDTLEADEINLNEQSGIIRAVGNVELSADDWRLRTHELLLDRDASRLIVPQPLELSAGNGIKLTAQSAELNDKLDSGKLTGLQVRLPDEGRFRAAYAEHAPTALTMRDAIYTSCAQCPDADNSQTGTPQWQIRAANIHYDHIAQNVVYRHPRLEVYGIPVFYIPYMAHAGPEVDRRSGFLAPRFVSSGDFGSGVETPYFVDLAPNYDLTVTPRFSEAQNVFLTNEWRHLTPFGKYEVTLFAHQPSDELADDTSRDTRLGVIGNGQFQLADWQIAFEAQDSSDDIFFKRYKIDDTDRLQNRLAFNRNFANQHITIEAYRFRNTLSAETASTVDEILPSLIHQLFFEDSVLGGQLSLTNHFTYETRNLGVDVGHLTSRLDWSWRHASRGGFIWSASNRLVLDNYQFDAEADDPVDGSEVDELLAANITAFTLAYPLHRISPYSRQILTPKIQLVLATDNEDYDAIPYIDGTSLDLTRTQLFQPLTTKDEASRVNLGVEHELQLMSRLHTQFFIGQSFNLSDRSFSTYSGYGEDGSDLLADLALFAGPLTLSQSARFNETGSRLLRSESRAELALQKFHLALEHSLYEAGQHSGDGVLEEAASHLSWDINDNWSMGAAVRENLETGERVEAEVIFGYEDECTIVQMTIERDYSSVANIEPNTSINFTFTLKTISGIEGR